MYSAECNAVKRGLDFASLNDSEVKKMLPPRLPVSHKGTYGTALLACGSEKMPGAACIAASGALRSGAGLVKLVFPFGAYIPIVSKLTEAVFVPVKPNAEGTFDSEAGEEIIKQASSASALLIGCGMGVNKDTVRTVQMVTQKAEIPLVVDADALNALSADTGVLKKTKAPVIITPHPGEMSRLCGKQINEILADTVGTALTFSASYGVITVLKTENTVVCSPEGRVYINTTGNSGLAKGGSGDLLSGMMVSLLAQGMDPYECACIAVYLHGRCADEVAAKLSQRGMLVSDMIDYLAEFYSKYE